MFTKTDRTPDDGTRRLPDEPLDGQYGRTLPLLQRVFIRVLVSEVRKMMDERDAEQRSRQAVQVPRVHGHVGVDPSAQRADMDGNRADRVPTYRDRTEQDG